MAKSKHSVIDLIRGKSTFTNEPLWYRIVVLIVQVIYFLLLIIGLSSTSCKLGSLSSSQQMPHRANHVVTWLPAPVDPD